MLCSYYGKTGLKAFPLNRYVVNRDGDGNVLEIVTKELIAREVLQADLPMPIPNPVGDDGNSQGYPSADVEVYTYVKCDEKEWSLDLAPRSGRHDHSW